MFPSVKDLNAMNSKILERQNVTNTLLLAIATMIATDSQTPEVREVLKKISGPMSDAIKRHLNVTL